MNQKKNYKTSNAGNIKLNTGHEATIYKNYKTWSHCHSVQARQSQETKNYRETTSALEPHDIPTRPGNNRLSEIKPLPLAQARQSHETKIAVKQLLLWSHTTY